MVVVYFNTQNFFNNFCPTVNFPHSTVDIIAPIGIDHSNIKYQELHIVLSNCQSAFLRLSISGISQNSESVILMKG